MDYLKHIKQAYEILREYKFFWVLGLFLVLGNIGNLLLPITAKPYLGYWISQIREVSLGTFALTVIGGVGLLLIYFLAKAALIIAVKGYLDHQEISLKKSLTAGQYFFLRVFGTSVLLGFLSALAAAVLTAPVMYLLNLDYQERAMSLGVLAGLIMIPVWLVITYLSILSANFICLYDQNIRESIRSSVNLVVKKWPQLLMASIFIWWRVALSFLALTFMLFLAIFVFEPQSTVLDGIVAVVAGLIFLFGSAMILAFHQTCWTLVFLSIIKPVKMEETEPVPAPEIV